MSESPRNLRRGELVRVRSREAILATLDERGCVEGLPFMPEMLDACGRVFRVEARAHKTCDTIHKTGGRRMNEAVHLEGLRCNGSAHGGCQAACLVFFKNVWLERADERDVARTEQVEDSTRAQRSPAAGPTPVPRMGEDKLRELTRVPTPDGSPPTAQTPYVCQITELPRATSPLPYWDVRQYVEDWRSGNVGLFDLLNRLFFRFTANALLHVPGYRLWLGLYDRVQALLGNPPYPVIVGQLKRTPSASLGLAPGDEVVVRPLPEIVATLDTRNKNRGMAFDKEQSRECGKRHVVEARVDRILDEATGRMVELPNDCLILKGVACRAHYSERRIACPRAIPSYWREAWLERAEPEGR